MTNITKLAVAALLGFTMFSTSAFADAAKGQKIYLKKMKAPCGFNGSKFAQSHTQKEWEDIYENGKLEEQINKLCPNIQKWNKKWDNDLFDFAHKYASDSGNIPSC